MSHNRIASIVGVAALCVASTAARGQDLTVRRSVGPPRTASISGVVTNDDGTPAAGLTVYVVQWLPWAGEPADRQLWTMGTPSRTDADGRYAVHGLWASHAVVVIPAEPTPTTGTANVGVLRTYFPGVADAARARTIAVAAGPITGVNFSVRRGPMVDVAFRFTPADPVPAGQSPATLTPLSVPDRLGGLSDLMAAVRGGTHHFPHVPPGTYLLSHDGAQGWVNEPIQIGSEPGAPTHQQIVSLHPYFSVTGRVELHFSDPAVTADIRASVLKAQTVSLNALPFLRGDRTTVPIAADGTFTFPRVPGRTYIVLLTPNGQWFTAHGYLGAVDSMTSGVRLSAGVTGARVVAADRDTVVRGVVRFEDQATVSNRNVIIFSENEADWRDNDGRRVRAAPIGDDGRYSTAGIAPGRYYFIVVDPALPFSPAQYAEAKRTGAPFDLGIGETKVLDITIRR